MKEAVLLAGEGMLLSSTAACLLLAGHDVYLLGQEVEEIKPNIQRHLQMAVEKLTPKPETGSLYLQSDIGTRKFSLGIVITEDDIRKKTNTMQQADGFLSEEAILAVNLYATELQEVQSIANTAARTVGLNWTEPAHTTFFLEIISNSKTDPKVLERIEELAKCWGKDPHHVKSGFSVRARLEAALTREALFLVANDYATCEDIDRNCRNDAGYYLPFAGNGRYMDLMGTSAYGMVMKDLNRHLSKENSLDAHSESLLADKKLGMETGEGFFCYTPDEVNSWKEKAESFSYKIHDLIKKYREEEL